MRQIFFTILILYLLGNVYILYRALQTLRRTKVGIKVGFAIIYIALIISFWYIFRNEKINHTLYVISSAIPIFTFYMVIWLFITDSIALIGKLFKSRIFANNKSRTLFRNSTFWIGCCSVIVLLIVGNYKYRHPDTKVINIVINKPLTSSQQHLKVVAISDVHLGYDTNKGMLKKYVNKINSLKPDLILIGGDLIDHSILPVRKQQMQEELNQLNAPLGIYMVPGNHEYYTGIQKVKHFLTQTKIHLLVDTTIQLSNKLTLIGRNDYSQKRKSLSSLLTNTNKKNPIILLDHQPRNLEEAVKEKIDLQFSGHTHNGQIWPFPFLVNKLFELGYGMKQTNNTYQYVSSGLSLWGPPFRIGTNSEIVVFNIMFK